MIWPSRDRLKTKRTFVITGFRDATPAEIEAISVAEIIGDKLMPAGAVQFGVARGLRQALETIVVDRRGRRSATVRPVLAAPAGSPAQRVS
jgi:hypothetical protein